MVTTTQADWQQRPFDTLRQKWVEIPTTKLGRRKTPDLLQLSDEELLSVWKASRDDVTTGTQWFHRGWYYELYRDFMRGKKVLDVGSGFGMDSLTFAQHGARLTFVDIAPSNLQVIERVGKLLGLEDLRFVHLENLDSLKALDDDYDVIMAMGSLHHAPQHVIRPEVQELLKHLKVGGRWLQLAYPKTRWAREGRPTFDKWGEMTDGPGTPWAEPYDLPKLLDLMAPAKFDVVLYREFHNADFNWFDLVYRGSGPDARTVSSGIGTVVSDYRTNEALVLDTQKDLVNGKPTIKTIARIVAKTLLGRYA